MLPCVMAVRCFRRRASLARSGRSRLHPQIPSMFVKTEKRADEVSSLSIWSRRRDYLRLYGYEERQGFYERLDSFASAARAAPSCVTAAGCFRKRAFLARGGRVNRQPRIMRHISKRFGGCGSNPSQQPRPRDGRNAISGSWSRRRDLNPRPLVPNRVGTKPVCPPLCASRRGCMACSSFSRTSAFAFAREP